MKMLTNCLALSMAAISVFFDEDTYLVAVKHVLNCFTVSP